MNGYVFNRMNKIKIPPQHKIAPGTQYAFTVNLAGDDLLHIMIGRYAALFKKMSEYVHFTMYPELSTVNRKLHYHGTITFKHWHSIMSFYDFVADKKDEMAIEMDFINWNDTNIFKNWSVYCIKDRHIMEPYLTHKKLPYKIINDSNILKTNDIHMNIKDALLYGLDDD